jgi:hypothetical protein
MMKTSLFNLQLILMFNSSISAQNGKNMLLIDRFKHNEKISSVDVGLVSNILFPFHKSYTQEQDSKKDISISTQTNTSDSPIFIGTFNIEKKGICSSKGYVLEDVKDRTEYDLKCAQFKELHKNDESFSTGTRYVSNKECVVIYQYQQRISGWGCNPTVYSIKIGTTLENCKNEMDKYYLKYPKEFFTQPEIVYSRCNTPEAITSSCPTYGFKLNTTPSYNCVSLSWWAISTTTNTVDAQGNFKQNKMPEATSFTLSYRKLGDLIWKTEVTQNTGQNLYSITGLNACTSYEVFMTTQCNNNTASSPTATIKFTTACKQPGATSVQNITQKSAKIVSERLSALISYPCNGTALTQIRLIEYKTNLGQWIEVTCNSGEPCLLTGLSVGTLYKVRTRYKYGENIYSNYTTEKSFTTLK